MLNDIALRGKPTSELESFKYFCQLLSKSILIISSYIGRTVSNLMHFRHSAVYYIVSYSSLLVLFFCYACCKVIYYSQLYSSLETFSACLLYTVCLNVDVRSNIIENTVVNVSWLTKFCILTAVYLQYTV